MSELAPPTQPSVIAAPMPTADRPRRRAVPAVDSQPWRRRAVMARRLGPFVLVHLAALGVFFVHFSPILLVAAAVSYVFLMIGSAGWMHRYFSHRCFRTSRLFQFVLAFWGTSANQRGPLWWAAHHRRHHAFSDTDRDPHSPTTLGFWRAHMGWFFEDSYIRTKHRWVRDLTRYPELRFIDRWYILPPMCYWAAWAGLGAWWGAATDRGAAVGALSLLVWGAIVGTVLAWHATFAINSITHLWGRRDYHTDDDSRNNLLVAAINLGEGWHNNHHYYPHSANSGFHWWQIDPTYWTIVLFEKVGLVWNVRRTPRGVVERRSG